MSKTAKPTDTPPRSSAPPREDLPERFDLRSHDIAADKMEELLRLFPEIRTEGGKIDFDRLKLALDETAAVGAAVEDVNIARHAVPDVLAYLQNETELTRSTLVRILRESGRLDEFFNHPQRFMDAVAGILKHELHRLLVDGVKYDRIEGAGSDAEWEMLLFKNEELINYLAAIHVTKSVYEYVVYDSEVEREFAKRLDQREDIKLFVKLPNWFRVETPVGEHNPDWAIIKHDGQAIYLVRETKDTHNFLKLRTTEADKIRCGQKHFEALGVDFKVAVTADEV